MSKVVIIGSNFAGMDAAMVLRKLDKNVEIVVIDRHNAEFYPATHKIISGDLDSSDIEVDLPTIYTKKNIEYKKDTIKSIDPKKNIVIGSEKYSYDYLIVALGAVGNYYGIPGADKHSVPFKTSEDSAIIKEKIINLESKDKYDIVVAGSGLTGVESIFELKTYLNRIAKNTDLHVVEVAPSIAPWANPSTQKLLKKIMVKDNIKIHEGFAIGKVEKDKIISKTNEEIPFDLLIWCAGLGVNPVIVNSDLAKDGKGMIVDNQLRSTSHKNIFGCGDVISIKDMPCPKTAHFATVQAPIAAYNVYASINNQGFEYFKVSTSPALVSLGEHGSIFVYKNFLWSRPRWFLNLAKNAIRKLWLSTRRN